MSLTAGGSGFPAGWSHANPIFNFCTYKYFYGPYVWVGQEPATSEDIAAIMPFAMGMDGIDFGTLCGTSDPDWKTEADVLKETDPCYR